MKLMSSGHFSYWCWSRMLLEWLKQKWNERALAAAHECPELLQRGSNPWCQITALLLDRMSTALPTPDLRYLDDVTASSVSEYSFCWERALLSFSFSRRVRGPP